MVNNHLFKDGICTIQNSTLQTLLMINNLVDFAVYLAWKAWKSLKKLEKYPSLYFCKKNMQITFNIKFILDQTNLFKGTVVNRTFQPLNGGNSLFNEFLPCDFSHPN